METAELRQLFLDHCRVIGFDFFLNGRSEIELYPEIKREEFQQPVILHKLKQILSPQAIHYLSVCDQLMIGLSKDNPDKIVYYHLENKNELLNHFRMNDTARRVHAFYQQQHVLPVMWIGLPERELRGGVIENVNLYYQKHFTKKA